MTVAPVVFPVGEHFVAYAARLLQTWIAATLRTQERCMLALSGGSTPKPVYAALAMHDGVEWGRVRIILVDERCVGPSDAQSNAAMIHEAFDARMEAEHIVAPNTTLPPQACADDYEERVLRLLGDAPIDILTLGMGEDGHIASLFPPVKNEALQRVGAVHTVTDRFAVKDRVSLTLGLLERSTHRLLLLSGEKKLAVFEDCVAAAHDEKRWPLHGLLEGLTVVTDAAGGEGRSVLQHV